jgi:signal transduction histidine kinase
MVGVVLVVGLLSLLLWGLFRQRSRLTKELESKISLTSQTNAILESQQRDLAASIAVRERLFSVLSHDLRSPVATLRGLLQLLDMQADSLSPADVRHLTSYTGQNLENLSNMLDGLLEWTQAQRDKVVENPIPIDPAELYAKLLTNLEPSLRRKKLKLQLTNAMDGKWMYADPALLEIILRNLLTNALKFSFEERSIGLWFYREPKTNDVFIRVADSGTGMVPERLKLLFQKEWQISERGTHGEKGAGVGLALCAEFAALCGWFFSAYSTVGRGTSIYLRMPKAAVTPPDRSTQQPRLSTGFPKPFGNSVERDSPITLLQRLP